MRVWRGEGPVPHCACPPERTRGLAEIVPVPRPACTLSYWARVRCVRAERWQSRGMFPRHAMSRSSFLSAQVESLGNAANKHLAPRSRGPTMPDVELRHHANAVWLVLRCIDVRECPSRSFSRPARCGHRRAASWRAWGWHVVRQGQRVGFRHSATSAGFLDCSGCRERSRPDNPGRRKRLAVLCVRHRRAS